MRRSSIASIQASFDCESASCPSSKVNLPDAGGGEWLPLEKRISAIIPTARRASLVHDASQKPFQWRDPQSEWYRVAATFFSFLLLGAIDASYGAILPAFQHYYSLSYIIVSLIFLSPFFGYIAAALLINIIHLRLGRLGVAIIGPLCHAISFLIITFHPPWAVVVCFAVLLGFGNGILDAAWNSWIGDMKNANQLMGFLHGFYGVGATVSPLIATVMIAKGQTRWWRFYYVLFGASILELVICTAAFWTSRPPQKHIPAGLEGEQEPKLASPNLEESTPITLLASLKHRVTSLAALLGFLYVGAEVALGGWIPLYFLTTKNSSRFSAGMILVGFWLGITVGTVALGFVTPRVGERIAVTVYICVAIALQLVFWLVPHFIGPAVAVSLLGFFLGPVFPTAIVVAMKLLPLELHVSATGLISTLGSGGSAVFPFAVGAIATKHGVEVMPPFVLGLLGVILLAWLALPKIPKG